MSRKNNKQHVNERRHMALARFRTLSKEEWEAEKLHHCEGHLTMDIPRLYQEYVSQKNAEFENLRAKVNDTGQRRLPKPQ